MSLIVNPCEKCVFYESQFKEYSLKAMKGDYTALEGLKSILDLALAEPRDSEIEEILKANPGICEGGGLCIYRRQELEELATRVNKITKDIKSIDVKLRPIPLLLGTLGTLSEKPVK